VRRGLITFLLGALCSASAPQRLSAQSDLSAVAGSVAAAWSRHDFAAVVGTGRVELRIAGISAAGPLPADQAIALLSAYARDAEELEVAVVTATAVSDVSGYAQLRRRYRRRGGDATLEETLLLGLVRGAGSDAAWRISVVEASGTERSR
jgi:hypothetical protein